MNIPLDINYIRMMEQCISNSWQNKIPITRKKALELKAFIIKELKNE